MTQPEQLFNAAEKGDARAVADLLEAGIQPDAHRTKYGTTALHVAAKR